ncbi:hypothetical protein HanHA300_Chr06g0196431 [Helianthus annuus]|nr:hypothetical protein HanHA300_Chr06g0196421 [Helianthus annuus]KAJ0559080.1 hypothetical protein HanHA300_Chr06g0196431 [Helianthus annuus]KAJ0564958.1 hypothetical protein HanIR_Chr06g0257321 [Helianthus annuus]KAJ0564959.1 hypothetical protein HanIR_Chr06g0257331 [Helianthus annuus]KAJ0572026.1 hypothetical protein HanHA89_Chr06g0211281 [Helianthus annuus]
MNGTFTLDYRCSSYALPLQVHTTRELKMAFFSREWIQMHQLLEIGVGVGLHVRTYQSTTQTFEDGFSTSCGYVNIIENYAFNQALESEKWLHSQLLINGLALATHITSKLIDFYNKCCQILDARKVFDEIPQRNTPGLFTTLLLNRVPAFPSHPPKP